MAQGGRKPGRGLSREPLAPFAKEHQAALLRELLPRGHGMTLLEVNCGPGVFLPLYRHFGFYTFAVEPDVELREKAAAAHRGVEIYPAGAGHLPYDDHGMDWVVLHLRDGELLECVGECLRVASRGCLVTFWNSISLAALCWKMDGMVQPCRHSAPGVWRALRKLKAGRVICRSTLFLPAGSWRRGCAISSWNGLFGKTLLGAWCALRIDLGSPGLGTPIGLPISAGIQKPMPAMEYSQKISGCEKDVTDS